MQCNLWFIRFNLDDDCRHLAIGNNKGEVRVWDIIGGDGDRDGARREYLLKYKDAKTCVRMPRFSGDGDLIATVSDGGRVLVYDFKKGREIGAGGV
ncbi:hypothetical protein TrRE_jg1750 [Triparma retinervis]|uniref:Uncharacterized protein n=1 Tax=Triparma retinervis TaxID=2557542 RepID=A0A9W7ANY1_9STRA|nr:hypothetical protein TrRE_jg1750 [Triparma retinervis]